MRANVDVASGRHEPDHELHMILREEKLLTQEAYPRRV
jgi:hypothetical protein